MKNRILLFLTAFVLFACFFAIMVGASDIYADFTKPGVNGESPIFNFRGYSLNENGGGISVEYDINRQALKDYENKIGKSLHFGVVFSHESNLQNGKPLDSLGNAIGDNQGKIYNSRIVDSKCELVTLIITGMSPEMYGEGVVMSLYVCDEDGVSYITDEGSRQIPQIVSYDSIFGPREVVVGGITYSTNGVTEPAWDRIRQQNSSIAEYNMGSEMSSSQLSSAKSKANLIALGGRLINMPAASSLMSHYLKNTGAEYTIDVGGFLKDDSGALSSRNKAINNALRAAEMLAQKGRQLTINQLTEGHPMQNSLATQNWQYAIGSYFDDVDIINLTVKEENGIKTYTADIKYIVTDFYNWDTNDYNKFKQIISPHDLHELHRGGIAREFMSYGEIIYKNITWTEGQTVEGLGF